MDLELLRTFQAVSETGSTTGAAGLLGVSQSAVSRRLAQLEKDLGLQLFMRERGRLLPTRDNRELKAQIVSLLEHGARLATRAQELGTGNAASTTLRIAVPASMVQSILPGILVDFLETHHRVQVEVHSGAYDTIERMLLDERAEVGFVRIPVHRSGLTTTPVIEAATVCVLPSDHPLAVKTVVAVRDLIGVPLILLGRMRQPRREIDELFFKVGLRPNIRLEVHSVMSACALVAHGLGVTLVNELMARDFCHMPIALRPLNEPIMHHFAFASSDTAPVTVAAQDFISVASRHLRASLAR
jgi:DNA-binding transcriptional LysR family regulator